MSEEVAVAEEAGLATVGELTPVPLDNETVEHHDVRLKVLELKDKVEQDYWDLSIELHKVYDGAYYVAWGYENFKEYAEGELDFRLRKAQYLVAIQTWFGKMDSAVQDWVTSLGWTKAKELVGRVTNENAWEWKERIEGKSYTDIAKLLREVKREEAVASGKEPDGDVEKPSRKAFSLFPSQLENVEAAVEKAKELANTEKDGHALDLIATDFLATNGSIDGGLDGYLSRVEKALNISIVGYDRQADEVVFGNALIEEISAGEK